MELKTAPTFEFTRAKQDEDQTTKNKITSKLTEATAQDELAPDSTKFAHGKANHRDSLQNEAAKSARATSAWQMGSPGPAGQQSHLLSAKTRGKLATLAQIGEDWLYLALLGIMMAILSFSMDYVIAFLLSSRLWLFNDMADRSLTIQFLAWSLAPVVLVTFSTGFVHLCSPTAIGSGIPEMKTILRGVVLNEYLTFRTLVAKVVGLTCTLGSGLPLGKEGPSVHMASIVATLLSKLVASFQGIYENESRASEMLSAACAVGVAATFYAPIGGVLFSIEVTTVYFAVRNYWRGFFAACCGATVWRLLGYWLKNDESISALFKTNFNTDYPFDPVELLAFTFIGATCGLAGAAYIKFHREIVQFFRRHKRLSEFLQKNRFVYPVIVTLIITGVNFPPFLGQYTASTLGTHATIEHLFSNRTWSLGARDLVSSAILDNWTTETSGFQVHLVAYIAMLFWTSALASTIPIPSGLFIPVLKMGAAYGRLLGELMHQAFPEGIRYSAGPVHTSSLIVPGSYAVVGAAALSGAVTHTISTSVILFEMTGQIVHIIPVILAVLIANAVCQSLQPSIYDSIIEIKKLPYLPPIASSNSSSHQILVRDFMNTRLAYLWKDRCTYDHVKSLLVDHKKLSSFPLVESPDSMKLLGSVSRPDLLKLLYLHLNRERRLQEVVWRRNSIVDSGLAKPKQQQEREPIKEGPELVSNQSDQKHHSAPARLRTREEPSLRIQIGLSSSASSSNSEPESPETATQLTGQLAEVAQLEVSANHELIEHERVAKLLNHYDRGTNMDSETLEASNRRVHRQIKQSTSLAIPRQTSGASQLALKPRPATSLAGSAPQSPSIGKRPAKSILKPSPSIMSNIYKRTGSYQSFAPGSLVNLDWPTTSVQSSPVSTSRLMTNRRAGSFLAPKLAELTARENQQQQQENEQQNQQQAISKIDKQDHDELLTPIRRRRVRLPQLRVVDMTPEEQEAWERDQLNQYIDIHRCQIDEAPFQLVEQTSLYRVHTLFSMLGLNHAYVTSFGRLVGVVALKDIRQAIEEMLQDRKMSVG